MKTPETKDQRAKYCGLKKICLTILLSTSAVGVMAINNPLPPEGEPLPTNRNPKDAAYGCPKTDDYIRISEVPIAISQACSKQMTYKGLPLDGQAEYCGRKGRKAFKSCISSKVNKCVEMSVIQERKVWPNYCPGAAFNK